jgi:hypothetical protein
LAGGKGACNRTLSTAERQRGAGFEVVCRGILSFDGEALSLVDSRDRQLRVITDQQVNTIKHVGEANRIAQCCGYDFFVIEGL